MHPGWQVWCPPSGKTKGDSRWNLRGKDINLWSEDTLPADWLGLGQYTREGAVRPATTGLTSSRLGVEYVENGWDFVRPEAQQKMDKSKMHCTLMCEAQPAKLTMQNGGIPYRLSTRRFTNESVVQVHSWPVFGIHLLRHKEVSWVDAFEVHQRFHGFDRVLSWEGRQLLV